MPSGLISRGIQYAGMARDARALRKATDECVRRNASAHLARRMGKLRGLPQKIGQMLSMSDDSDRADAFASLTDAAEAMPFEDVRPILEAAWGRPVESVVRRIDERGSAASLGQVHRAELSDGREVAVKVRYPGIREAVMNDLKVLGWLSAPVGDLRRGFDLADYRGAILDDLNCELDYRLEADNQERYRRTAAVDMPEWIVPRIIAEHSSDDVLVSEWVEGETIEDAAHWSAAERSGLAIALVRGLLTSLFRHGFVHADPNPGNYRFVQTKAGPRIVLYDFGSVTEIEPTHRLALLRLIQATVAGTGDPYKLLVVLGFSEALLGPIRAKLPAVCRTIFEPFCVPGKYHPDGRRRAERLDDILGEDRWNFRMSGPAHLIFLMRAFGGLTYYLTKLDSDAAWSIALKPHLAEHQSVLAEIDAAPGVDAAASFDTLARHLKIRVIEAGAQKIGLTFPAAAVDSLDSLIDDELARRISSQGVDVGAIVRDVRRSGYAPQSLFMLEETSEQKGVQVWLE